MMMTPMMTSALCCNYLLVYSWNHLPVDMMDELILFQVVDYDFDGWGGEDDDDDDGDDGFFD